MLHYTDNLEYVPMPSPTAAPTPMTNVVLSTATSKLHPECPLLYVDCGGFISIVLSDKTDGVVQGSTIMFHTPRPIGGIGSGVAIGQCTRVIGIAIPGSTDVILSEHHPLIVTTATYEIVATNSRGSVVPASAAIRMPNYLAAH
jgi:hypothetical protein